MNAVIFTETAPYGDELVHPFRCWQSACGITIEYLPEGYTMADLPDGRMLVVPQGPMHYVTHQANYGAGADGSTLDELVKNTNWDFIPVLQDTIINTEKAA